MEMDEELALPDGACYAGRADNGLHTWRAAPAEDNAADEKSARFILYSGREVRFNPAWEEGGDIIRTQEFRLANYRRNPVVLADHDMDRVIGAGTAKIVQAGELYQLHGEVRWDLHESNPLAVLIAGQHARGMRKAVSIGFMPGKGTVPRTKLPEEDPARMDPDKVREWRAGRMIRHPELYEWSSVGVPKDPGAVQLRAWAAEAEDPDEQIRRVVSELLPAELGRWVRDAVRHNAEVRAAIAAVALEQIPTPPTEPPAPSDWFEDWT